MTDFPVVVDPVRLMSLTAGFPTRASCASGPVAGRIWRIPFGNPAAVSSGARARAVRGVSSEGFQMAVQPAARAAAIFFAP